MDFGAKDEKTQQHSALGIGTGRILRGIEYQK
jgi:hypothetical protein